MKEIRLTKRGAAPHRARRCAIYCCRILPVFCARKLAYRTQISGEKKKMKAGVIRPKRKIEENHLT